MQDGVPHITTNDSNWFGSLFIFAKDLFLDLFMALGPSLNYVFQSKKFKKTKSSKGFSNFLCLVTILSHTLKVFFWFGKKFKITLLVQSILVIFMQLYLIYLVIKYKEDKQKSNDDYILVNNASRKEKIKKFAKDNFFNWSKTFNSKLIWRWDDVAEYYKFYFFIILILTIFSVSLGINNKYYINIIGGVSIFLEMLCSIPQIIEMQKSKNQRNISKIMVFMWFSGNLLKIYYNTANNSPIQLIIGSYIQVFFNCILIYQIFYYYRRNRRESLDRAEMDLMAKNDNEKNEEEVEEVKLIDEKKDI